MHCSLALSIKNIVMGNSVSMCVHAEYLTMIGHAQCTVCLR